MNVNADTSTIPTTIDDAVGSTNPEVQVLTDQVTDQINHAIADADTTVTVDADTTAAQDAMAGLSDSASTASESVGGLGGNLEQVRAASGLATGSMAGLEGGLAATVPAAAGVAAGVAAVAEAGKFLFESALQSDTAVRRLASAFGELAPKIEATNIPGFAKDLTELAQKTGQDDEALRIAAARIGDFGKSAGVAAPQVATTAQQILLLGEHLAVTNPTLGQAGQIAETLTGALARGGRATSQFGIALTSTEINARALRDTGKSSAAELNNYEKAAAGAAIVTEQLGSKLKTDIVAGAKGSELSLRSLKEEFKNAAEDLGKPLLQPVIQATREATPILIQLAKLFGDIATTALPLLSHGLQVVGPLFSSVAVVVEGLLTVARPLISVIDAIPAPLLSMAAGALLVSRVLPVLNTGIGNLLASAGQGGAGVGALGTAISAINPVTVVAGIGLFALAKAASDHAKAARQDAADVKALTDALADSTKTVQDAVAGSAPLQKLAGSFTEAGLGTAGLTEAVAGGRGALSDYLTSLKAAADQSGGFSRTQKELVLQAIDLAAKTNDSAHATLTHAVATGTLSRSEEVLAIQTNTTSDGHVNWTAILNQLHPVIAKASLETDKFGNALQQHTSAAQTFANATQEISARQLERLVTTGQLTQAQLDANVTLHSAADGSIDYAAALKDLNPATADLALQQAKLASGLDDVHTQFRIAADAADIFKTSVQEAIDPILNADQANIRFHDELQRTADALVKSAGSIDLNSEAGRRARGELDQLVSTGNTYIEMLLRQGAPQAQVTAAKNDEVGALERLKAQYPALTPLIETYIAKIKEIQPTTGTEIKVQGEKEAIDAINRVKNAFAGIQVTGTFDLTKPKTGAGHAAGGDAFGGPTGLIIPVGEKGPETVFIPPGVNAHVFDAQASRNGVGGGPIVGELHIHEVAGSPEATGFVAAREIGLRAKRG